jgi:hypothetical protein
VAGQRFNLASAGPRQGNVLRNQFLANRLAARNALAQATFRGNYTNRFANRFWWGHSKRHHHHRFPRIFVIGWAGPLFWPYAYDDFIGYTFYPHAYDTFWPYAYDDLYVGMFGRYAYRAPQPQPATGGKAPVTAELCSGETAGLTDWPIEQIALAVEPNGEQRAALDALKQATASALGILRTACPTALPSTPIGRLDAMSKRIEAMLAAVRTLRPALEAFYASLNDEQRARFNALGPDENEQPDQQDLAQMCSERASGIASLPIDRIESTVRPNQAQRVALQGLRDAMSDAVSLLKAECPTYRPLTPVGRIEAMEQRLDAMLRALETVQPALARFYASLNAEQKERFNRLSPAQS